MNVVSVLNLFHDFIFIQLESGDGEHSRSYSMSSLWLFPLLCFCFVFSEENYVRLEESSMDHWTIHGLACTQCNAFLYADSKYICEWILTLLHFWHYFVGNKESENLAFCKSKFSHNHLLLYCFFFCSPCSFPIPSFLC